MVTSLENQAALNRPGTDRRRRGRLQSETLGWILPMRIQPAMHLPDDEEGWEVQIYNLSRLGVGFITTAPLALGSQHRLRIGRGPVKRSRSIRVVVCRQSNDGTYTIGAEFVDMGQRQLARAS